MGNVLFDVNICVYHSVNYLDAVQSWDYYVVENYEKHRVILSTIQASELLSYPKVETDAFVRDKRGICRSDL